LHRLSYCCQTPRCTARWEPGLQRTIKLGLEYLLNTATSLNRFERSGSISWRYGNHTHNTHFPQTQHRSCFSIPTNVSASGLSAAWHRRFLGLGVSRRAFSLQFPFQRTLPETISTLDILYCLFFLRVLFSIQLAYFPDHGLSFFFF
jgi:hypothetical protein